MIDGFSGSFEEHGFYLLLGESGSGKTTFLNLLAGFLPFESGSICWDERVFEGRVLHPQDAPFDYITQDCFFVDFLTVEENLRMIEELRSASAVIGSDASSSSEDIQKRVLAFLESFGMADKADAWPTVLSGGERGRLAIIRALLKGKRVLLLDEPTAALDEENKRTVFELLSSLKAEVLILCATHDAEAVPYADAILHFSKTEKTPRMERCLPGTERERTEKSPRGAFPVSSLSGSDMCSSAQGKKARFFLKPWFTSTRREQSAQWMFLAFLIVSLLLLFLADTPSHKLLATGNDFYHVNVLHLEVFQNQKLSDLQFDRDGVSDIAIDYRLSCPERIIPPETNPYDANICVLPEKEEDCKIASLIAYGSYFTAPAQIILGPEMADGLSGGKPEKLIGKTIQRKIYGLGTVNLEIVGIFGTMNDAQRMYLNACGADYLTGEHYAPEYHNWIFSVNTALLRDLSEDDTFYMGDGQRGWFLYFRSNAAREAFMKTYQTELRRQDAALNNLALDGEVAFITADLSLFLLPIALGVALFTAVFYVELNRMSRAEFTYNNAFVSVFEYAGYQKNTILRELIRLCMFRFLKLLSIAGIMAFGTALLLNALNAIFIFVNFQLFSFHPWLILLYYGGMILTAYIVILLRFKKVHLRSWYENLIANRDVL